MSIFNGEASTITTSINLDHITLAVRLFLSKQNAWFKVLGPQLRLLEQQHLSHNFHTPDIEPFI